jgi:hypothetical protein
VRGGAGQWLVLMPNVQPLLVSSTGLRLAPMMPAAFQQHTSPDQLGRPAAGLSLAGGGGDSGLVASAAPQPRREIIHVFSRPEPALHPLLPSPLPAGGRVQRLELSTDNPLTKQYANLKQ